jgi:hypothetical protein
MKKWIVFNKAYINVDKIVYVRMMTSYVEIGLSQSGMHENFINEVELIRRYEEVLMELGIL